MQEPGPQTPEQRAAGRHSRKVCLLGDTCDSRAIARLAQGCDLLSHEATFLSSMWQKAERATHSTAQQAGAFAAQVSVPAAIVDTQQCCRAAVQLTA